MTITWSARSSGPRRSCLTPRCRSPRSPMLSLPTVSPLYLPCSLSPALSPLYLPCSLYPLSPLYLCLSVLSLSLVGMITSDHALDWRRPNSTEPTNRPPARLVLDGAAALVNSVPDGRAVGALYPGRPSPPDTRGMASSPVHAGWAGLPTLGNNAHSVTYTDSVGQVVWSSDSTSRSRRARFCPACAVVARWRSGRPSLCTALCEAPVVSDPADPAGPRPDAVPSRRRTALCGRRHPPAPDLPRSWLQRPPDPQLRPSSPTASLSQLLQATHRRSDLTAHPVSQQSVLSAKHDYPCFFACPLSVDPRLFTQFSFRFPVNVFVNHFSTECSSLSIALSSKLSSTNEMEKLLAL